MLALSVQQPWPWLIFYANKGVENRTWAPPAGLVGQRFAIHASARPQSLEPLEVLGDVVGHDIAACWEPPVPKLQELPLGVLLGTVELAGVTRDGQLYGGRKTRWFVGPYGWVLRRPRALATPIPAKGRLGLWTVEPDAAALLEAA